MSSCYCNKNLYHRIFSLIFFAQYKNEYAIQNRHQFTESFVQEHINWFGVVIDFLREQRDILENNLFRNNGEQQSTDRRLSNSN